MAEKRSRKKPLEDAIGSVISNTDLLFEIFLRLPVISLLRFKLMSKSWLSLISDPEFSVSHSRRNTIESPVSDFYYQDSKRDVSLSLDYGSTIPSLTCLESIRQNVEPNNNPEIVDSCKGLILLIQRRSWRLIVVNPSTQKYRLLPTPSELFDPLIRYRDTQKCEFLLAFEPLKSHHYKVVIFYEESGWGGHFCIFIFSSKSGSWKEISVSASPAQHSTRRIYWNGAIHWLNGRNIHLRFDVDTEKMIENQLPPKPKILWRDKNKYFGESNGRLFLIQCRDSGALGFRMLEMNTHTGYWDIKHHINLRPLVLQFPEVQAKSRYEGHKYSVLYVKSGDDMKNCSLILAIPGKVVLYEVKKGKTHTNSKVVCELTNEFSPWGWQSRSFHPYIQCLASV